MLLLAENTTQNVSVLAPAAPAAQAIINLLILVCAIAAVIFVIVEGVLFYSVWRFRRRDNQPHVAGDTEPPQLYGSKPIEIAWTAAPAIIVLFIALVTTRTLWEVKATEPAPQSNDNTLFVTVIGRQWWWEYRYDKYNGRKLGFITANELHIPAGSADTPRLVYLRLESADVCHSYWVPRLNGKIDLIPGQVNTLLLQSDQPGLMLGQCAEYCGTQHANMLLRVVVDTPDEFDRWAENEIRPAVDDPDQRRGRDLFLSQSCVNCHRVRGTAAAGSYAPDLTHLMARQTLASGMVENTPPILRRWIHDPQTIKPGCLMPAFGLGQRDEEAIVSYLETLR